MRKYFIYLVVILAMALLLPNCKKESKKSEVSTDYREKYAGNWDFTVYTRQFPLDSIFESDTIYYLGNISLENSNQIKIQYTEDNSIVLDVDESGNLSGFPTHYSNGEFTGNTNLYLYLRWGGLGEGTIHTVNGIKQ